MSVDRPMRLISSRLTFFLKRVFPAAWFLAVLAAAVAAGLDAGREVRVEFLLFPAVMAFVGYVVMKMLIFDLADEVWDAGTELVVKNRGIEERVPLSAIMNVSYTVLVNPQRVTLSLRHPTLLGREVTFTPPSRFVPFSRSPIVEDLIRRIDAARRG